MKDNILYVKIDQNIAVANKNVTLGDIAKLYHIDQKIVNNLKQLEIYKIDSKKENKFVFCILKVVKLISEKYPQLEIVNLGETDFVISYIPKKPKNKLIEYGKTVFVSLSVFFGSSFAIMTFNEDASVKDIFDKIYEIVTGTSQHDFKIMELAYSIGIPLGTIIFFNHFTKMKINNDPTPLQIQMRTYEEDANKTVIENASREGKENDID
ncbi:MAG: Stage sporulation protein [Herbinix sp.]|jgi:stage V sporulation protein AA|nr:Stage sporulation protein [Herbinix sp.]